MTGGIQIVATAVAAVFLLGIAASCLVWPRAVQNYAIKTSSKRFNPFLSWMRTPEYVWSLRIIGVIALFMLVVLSIALLRGQR
jgi:hypothetical protein